MILLVLNLTMTAAMFGVIWLIQLVHYPMFEGLNEKSFLKWHAFHSRKITLLVAPLMVGELVSSVWLAVIRADVASFGLLAITVLVWLATFFVSVPIHGSLGQSEAMERKQPQELIRKLVATNWIRTALYTLKIIALVAIFIIESTVER